MPAKKKTPKKASESPETPPVKAYPAGAEPAQQTSQDDDEQGSGSGSGSYREISFGSMNEAEANMFVDSVENMHEKTGGSSPGWQTTHTAKSSESFRKYVFTIEEDSLR